ncbi:hypothetical protein [Aureitalea marina]|uniref:hypothetical protein n=1 Tax=Aureitalea marina TaxID=930804 RepID=UPI0011B045E9|nr:hypothetical protein [Aureitalea marina]
MSTLVSILLSVVLSVLPIGTLKKDTAQQTTGIEVLGCQDDIPGLNPQYLITENELLSVNK